MGYQLGVLISCNTLMHLRQPFCIFGRVREHPDPWSSNSPISLSNLGQLKAPCIRVLHHVWDTAQKCKVVNTVNVSPMGIETRPVNIPPFHWNKEGRQRVLVPSRVSVGIKLPGRENLLNILEPFWPWQSRQNLRKQRPKPRAIHWNALCAQSAPTRTTRARLATKICLFLTESSDMNINSHLIPPAWYIMAVRVWPSSRFSTNQKKTSKDHQSPKIYPPWN